MNGIGEALHATRLLVYDEENRQVIATHSSVNGQCIHDRINGTKTRYRNTMEFRSVWHKDSVRQMD